MKTILVFPFNLQAHYLRCLVFAARYDSDKFRILFIDSSRYGSYAIESGYDTFSCEQFEPAYVMECAEKFDFSWLNEHDVERVLTSQVEAIQTYKADIVIGDVSPTLKMAAELTGTKYVSILNGYMTRHYAYTRPVSRKMIAYKLVNKLPIKLSDRITNFAEQIAFRYVHRYFRKLRRKYHLQPVKNYLAELEGHENVICDYEFLFPQRPLPANFKVIGPLVYHPQPMDQEWLQTLPTDKPVILVAMGSTGDWNALRFLNDPGFEQYTIIAAGDEQNELSAAHIIKKPFVDLSKVLAKADLMICHGGNGTIYHGILNAVYMLCVPTNFEQEWNIGALERNGFGRAVQFSDPDRWKMLLEESIAMQQHQLVV